MKKPAIALIFLGFLVGPAMANPEVAAAPDVASGDEPTDEPPVLLSRPLHGSISAGGGPLLTGAGERSRWRGHAEIDLLPGGGAGRWGGGLAVRALDADGGMALGSLLYEAAAARPVLTMYLHADAGYAWEQEAAVAGVGLQTQLGFFGPLVAITDLGGHLIFDDLLEPTLVFSTSLRLGLAR